uniref:cytochrome b n=1 Tax=Aleurodicus rugioperculatus TaxID=1608326 RepID=UPI00286C2F89|nr:cytochrome b [Aleurodicus rugioperculatus]WKT15081.1 cytochrome b [Aleurodicus rugioperculatus]
MNMKMIRKNMFLFKDLNNFIIDLGVPSNLYLWWNFGSLLGLIFMIQFITGLFLTFHYASNVMVAFDSVIHIMRDVNSGWLLRYMHINGASFFFIFIYIHIGRGLYYFSFKKKMVWITGVVILLLLMMIAFMGYILPWGQMSFWGATVITNLLSAIPLWGDLIVTWIWGGFSVSNATLNRFYSFHFFFPFILIFMIFFHLLFLHLNGSSNSLGLSNTYDKIKFYPYFMLKDIMGFMIFFFFFFIIIFFNPLILSDSENFIKANSLITPVHIQPEWYYLFAYAILRSITSKLGGVIALFFSILILLILLFLKSKFNGLMFYPILKLFFFFFVFIVLILTWLGSKQVEYPYLILGQLMTFFFFFFFFFLLFFVNIWDYILN